MKRTIPKGWLLILLIASSLLACTPLSQNNQTKTSGGTNYSFWWPFGNRDLWSHFRSESKVTDASAIPQVKQQINRYVQYKDKLSKSMANSQPYIYYIYQEAQKRNLPIELALLPVIESGYDPYAYSHKGAAGLWQLMPKTADQYGIPQNRIYDGRRDVIASTNAALDHLTFLHNYFKGDLLLALAAYDSGLKRVTNAIQQNARAGKSTDFWSLPLPKETKDYVPRLLAIATIVNNAERYGVDLPSVKFEPYLTQVNMNHSITLPQAAQLAEMDLEHVYRLNPGFNPWSSITSTSNRLILPVGNAAIFERNLRSLPNTGNIVLAQREPAVDKPRSRSTVDSRLAANQLAESIAAAFRNRDQFLSGPVMVAAKEKPSIYISNRSQAGIKKISPLTGKNNYVLAAQNSSDSLSKLDGAFITTTKHSVINRNSHVNVTKKNATIKKSSKLIRYQVKNGDSLWKIARLHNVSVDSIKKWNNIRNESNVPNGKKLLIYLS